MIYLVGSPLFHKFTHLENDKSYVLTRAGNRKFKQINRKILDARANWNSKSLSVLPKEIWAHILSFLGEAKFWSKAGRICTAWSAHYQKWKNSAEAQEQFWWAYMVHTEIDLRTHHKYHSFFASHTEIDFLKKYRGYLYPDVSMPDFSRLPMDVVPYSVRKNPHIPSKYASVGWWTSTDIGFMITQKDLDLQKKYKTKKYPPPRPYDDVKGFNQEDSLTICPSLPPTSERTGGIFHIIEVG
jgi:hypothetical protein